jgi:CubicO group peptidase (beta-lactamase class C family)
MPGSDRITLRMLVTHRAGIPNRNSIPYDEEAWQPNTLDSLVQVLAHQPLDFEPGSQRRYSNGGYALLAYVIEQCTGRTYADLATKTGGGSLVSTVGDLHRFLRAAYRDNVIRVATWRELLPLSDSTLTFQGRCPGFNLRRATETGGRAPVNPRAV